MFCACGVHAFAFVSILIQMPATTGDSADLPQPPAAAVVTPSSGVPIDADHPSEDSLPNVKDDPPAADAQGPPADAAFKSDRLRAKVLKRASPSSSESTTRERPWYRSSFVALAAVVGLILLVSYLLRRYVPAVRVLGGGMLNVVQRTPLSSKQSIALVQVGRRMVLIGITPDHINSLSVIEDAEECAYLRDRAGKDAGRSRPGFDKLLSVEADRFDREPLEVPIDRTAPAGGRRAADTSKHVRDTRGHLEGMLKKLRGMQVE